MVKVLQFRMHTSLFTPVAAEAPVFSTSMVYVAVVPPSVWVTVGVEVLFLTRRPPTSVVTVSVSGPAVAEVRLAVSCSLPMPPGKVVTWTWPYSPGPRSGSPLQVTTPPDSVPPFTLPRSFGFRNIGEVVQRGLELFAALDLSPSLHATASYTWQDEPELSGGDAQLVVNTPPEHQASVVADVALDHSGGTMTDASIKGAAP